MHAEGLTTIGITNRTGKNNEEFASSDVSPLGFLIYCSADKKYIQELFITNNDQILLAISKAR